MEPPTLLKLSNGFRVVFVPYRNSEVVSFSLLGKGGSNYEKADEVGVAHFLEHAVFDGTKKYPSREKLSGLIQNLGGSFGGSTGRDGVKYWVRLVKKDVEQGFGFLSELVLQPLIEEKLMGKNKGIIEQEINRFKDSADLYVPRIASKLLFPNQRYGMLNSGDVEDIKSITREKVLSFIKENYIAQNFVLGISGDLDVDLINCLASKYFSVVPVGHTLELPSPTKSPFLDLYVENRPTLKQAHCEVCFYGYTDNDAKKYACAILSSALGGGVLSRLFKSIRGKGLAYVVGSHINFSQKYGILSIYAGLSENNLNKSLVLIKKEIDKIKEKLITKEEYERVLSRISASYIFAAEDSLNRASYYADLVLFDKKVRSHLEEIERFKAVTREEVREVANEIFSQNPKIVALTPSLRKEDIRF